MSSLKDNVLIFRITRLRDEQAFSEFFRRTYPRIYRYTLARVDRQEVAEDIVEEAFIQVWRQIFVEQQQVLYLVALLMTIARRLVIDYWRKAQRHPTVSLGEDVGEAISDHNIFLKKLETSADMEQIKKALEELKVEYREVFLLRFLDELDIHEISVIMGKSRGAVRVLLHRAIRTLRAKLVS